MSVTAAELRAMMRSIGEHYELLTNNRASAEEECRVLNRAIDEQTAQIQRLTADLRELQTIYSIKLSSIPTYIPDPNPDPVTEAAEPGCEFAPIVPFDTITRPVMVDMLTDIIDSTTVHSTAFSPTGALLAIGSDGMLRVYDIERDVFRIECPVEEADKRGTNNVHSISWTGDEQHVVFGCEDGKVRVLPMEAPETCSSFDPCDGEVFCVVVAQRDGWIAVADGSGTVSIFKIDQSEPVRVMRREKRDNVGAISLAIALDNRLIAVGYGDGKVMVWDQETGKSLMEEDCHRDGVYGIQFGGKDQLGEMVITGSLDGTFKVWEMTLEGEKCGFKCRATGRVGEVRAVAVPSVGNLFMLGFKDSSVAIGSMSNGVIWYSLKAHTDVVTSITCSPRGDMFCTGSGDRSVKIWSIRPEECE